MVSRRLYTKGIAVVSILVFCLLSVGWGPPRETSDYYNPETYPKYPQFNSTQNNPAWGFTPDFASIREAGTESWNQDDIVHLELGKTYDVVAFYENDAPLNSNETANARMWVDFPAIVKAGLTVQGTISISADNTMPQSIWSTITFKSDQDILIRFVPDSGIIVYSNVYNEERALPNGGRDLFTEKGQLLGYNLDGSVVGGDVDSAYIRFQIVADYPDFELSVSMRKLTETKWNNRVQVQSSERVWVKFEYMNTGSILQNNVVLREVLPLGTSYVSGSSYLVNPDNPDGIAIMDGIASTEGMNIGNYRPGESALVLFQIEIGDLPFNDIRNTAYIITSNGSRGIVSGFDTRLNTSLHLTFSMDNPFIYLIFATIPALIVTVIGVWLSYRFDLHKMKKKKVALEKQE